MSDTPQQLAAAALVPAAAAIVAAAATTAAAAAPAPEATPATPATKAAPPAEDTPKHAETPAANGTDQEEEAPAENGDKADPPASKPEQESKEPADKDPQTEEAGDQSWYGAAPDEAITKQLSDSLGDEIAALYVKACCQLDGAKEDANRVSLASGTFVSALKKVPVDQQMSVAFGEMSLAYGRALVKFIEIEGHGSTAVTAKLVKILQSAVAGGRPVVDDEEGAPADGADDEDAAAKDDAEKKPDAESTEANADSNAESKAEDGATKPAPDEAKLDDTDKNKEGEADDEIEVAVEKRDVEKKEDGEDEQDEDTEDLDLAWTQLEVARVIFTREKLTDREAECRYTLGKLLMACDEGKQAGAEFASAAMLFKQCEDQRRVAECHYQNFLAIRNSDRSQAAQALRDAVTAMEALGGADDVLAEMKTDLKDFEATIADEEKAKASVVPTEVQVVRPKRKRDVEAAKAEEAAKTTPTANGNGTTEAEAKANGNGSADAGATEAKTEGTEEKKSAEPTTQDVTMKDGGDAAAVADGSATATKTDGATDGTAENVAKKPRLDEENKVAEEGESTGAATA